MRYLIVIVLSIGLLGSCWFGKELISGEILVVIGLFIGFEKVDCVGEGF